MKKLLEQIIKFGLVGVMNTAISYIAYSLIIFLFGENMYVLGNTLGFILGTLNSYFMNNKFVFKEEDDKEKRVWWQVLLKTFAAYAFSGLILSNVLLWLWLDIIKIERFFGGFAAYIAPILNMIITIPVNFIINKFWAYRQKNLNQDKNDTQDNE